MSLLPPNATKFEKAVEQSIKYNVDPNILAGFKFNQPSSKILLSMSWEYSLAQIKVDNFKERIIQGLEFHRLKGTPYSLRRIEANLELGKMLAWLFFLDHNSC